jgi:hypothetical protein
VILDAVTAKRPRLQRHGRRCCGVLRPHQGMFDALGVLPSRKLAPVDDRLGDSQLMNHSADGHRSLGSVYRQRARATLGKPLQSVQRSEGELAAGSFALSAQGCHLLSENLGLTHPGRTCHGVPRPSAALTKTTTYGGPRHLEWPGCRHVLVR